MVYEFYLSLSRQQLLRVYQGQARHIQVRDRRGLLIQLGVNKLTPFVSHSGVQGWFRLQTDQQHRFVSLQPIGD